MKKTVILFCSVFIFALFCTFAVGARVDDSAYSATEDMTPGTNIPDSGTEEKSGKESEGALERALESAKDKAEDVRNGLMTGASDAVKDVEDGSATAKTLGIVIAIIAAVAVIVALILIASKKNDRDNRNCRGENRR